MIPSDTNSSTITFPKESRIDEIEDKNFKNSVMNMFTDFKEVLNKYSKQRPWKQKQLNEIMKILQDMEVGFNKEIESLMNHWTEINLKWNLNKTLRGKCHQQIKWIGR